MGRKNALHQQNPFLGIITLIILPVLFVFKTIGDILIVFGKSILNLELRTYNIFLKIPKFFKKKFHLKKERVIYRRKSVRLPVIRLPEIRMPEFGAPLFISRFFKKRRYFSFFQLFFLKTKYLLFGAIFVTIAVIVYTVNSIVVALPNPNYLTLRDVPATTKIYDRNGKFLYEIYGEENRTPMKLSQIPKMVKDATIAIEDKEFYSHNGFSLKGIIRSLVHNFSSPNSLEGGSTITQQLIRNTFLTPEKTVIRKLKELALSVWTEQLYTKDAILEMYLNQVPYGGVSFGIEAASENYFGKKVNELTTAQAALLAGLPASPTLYSPFGSHPELALARQREVLENMVQSGFISNEEKEKAIITPLNFRKPYIPISAPHFVMYVRDLLIEQYGPKFVNQAGLRVVTTLDLNLQENAQKIVSDNIDKLENLKVGNGAALITDPKTGEILAMVGSRNYFDTIKEGNVNVTLSLRQPGSSIKAVTYAAALSSGFTAASILDDSPVSYSLNNNSVYSPVNYDGKFHGKIPLRVAFASSYNVPAVKVLASIGVNRIINFGRLMGITSWDSNYPYGLSLTLGGGDVTMLDMAKVYGTLAAKGKRLDTTPFLKITNWKGEEIPLPKQNPVPALDPGVAFILSDILADNSARTPAFGPNSSLVIPGKTVAVKTGTSDSKRDNWTIGFTPDYAVTVWVGNNDNSPMDPQLTSGVTGAAPIWHELMVKLLENKPNSAFEVPENVVSAYCFGKKEFYLKNTLPANCSQSIPNSPLPTKANP